MYFFKTWILIILIFPIVAFAMMMAWIYDYLSWPSYVLDSFFVQSLSSASECLIKSLMPCSIKQQTSAPKELDSAEAEETKKQCDLFIFFSLSLISHHKKHRRVHMHTVKQQEFSDGQGTVHRRNRHFSPWCPYPPWCQFKIIPSASRSSISLHSYISVSLNYHYCRGFRHNWQHIQDTYHYLCTRLSCTSCLNFPL